MTALARRLDRLEASNGAERCIVITGGTADDADAALARRGIIATASDLVVRVRAVMGIAKPERVTVNGVVIAPSVGDDA